MYSTKLNVFEFEDYRCFLKLTVEYCRQAYIDFSYRNFAKRAGFSSPNFLLLLINGERNISQDASEKITNAFGLNKAQTQFFKKLVLFNQSQVSAERAQYAKELAKARVEQNIHLLSAEKFEYFSSWKNIVIRELIVKNPGLCADRICKLIVPTLKRTEVQSSIELMCRLSLLENFENGFRSTENNITTGDSFVSTAVVEYHRQNLELSNSALDRFNKDERYITATTVGLSEDSLALVKEKVNQLRREILVLSEIDQSADKIHQVNIQIFPLTQKIELENL